MRLIDADQIGLTNMEIIMCNGDYKEALKILIDKIDNAPTIESDILTCKDCKYADDKPISDGRHWCNIHGFFMYYCSDAERREE